jgi:hypothetical protein
MIAYPIYKHIAKAQQIQLPIQSFVKELVNAGPISPKSFRVCPLTKNKINTGAVARLLRID